MKEKTFARIIRYLFMFIFYTYLSTLLAVGVILWYYGRDVTITINGWILALGLASILFKGYVYRLVVDYFKCKEIDADIEEEVEKLGSRKGYV